MMQELMEVKGGNEGYGFLIERDAGFISPDDPRNKEVIDKLKNTEDKNNGVEIVDRLTVFAVFQKYDIKNANGRIYPEAILKKQVELYKEKIRDRRSYGELNHPESVSLDGDRLAFGITDLWWEEHTLVGKMELILSPGFVKYGVISCVGDKLANYLRLGWTMGVSSRGLGSVEKDRFTGDYIVQDDFEITCWDSVCDPSTIGSFINPRKENLNQYIESKSANKSKIIEGLDRFISDKNIL
jgi:hypothetical protein